MPREIITIQIGQCGNQSKRWSMQSGPSSGSSCAGSTASVPAASSRSTPPITTGSRTGRTSSSTRQTTTTTSPGPSWWTWSQEYTCQHSGDKHDPVQPVRQPLQSRKHLHLQGGRRGRQQLGQWVRAGGEVSGGYHGHDRQGGRWV